MSKVGSTKIKFHDPRGKEFCVYLWPCSHKMKIYYFFAHPLLHSEAYIRKATSIVLMTKKGSTIFFKFHEPRGKDSYSRALSFKSL